MQPPQTTPPTVSLYVRWRKTRTLPSSAKTSERADFYDVAVVPTVPLHPNLQVRLLLLSNTSLHTPSLHLGETPKYDAYDLFVEGRLEQTTSTSPDETTYMVRNKVWWNEIRCAHITTPSDLDPFPLINLYWDPVSCIYAQKTPIRKGLVPIEAVTRHAPPALALASPFNNYEAADEMEYDRTASGETVTGIRRRVGYWPTGPPTIFGGERAIGP